MLSGMNALHLNAQAAPPATALSFLWLLLSEQKRFPTCHVTLHHCCVFTGSQLMAVPAYKLPESLGSRLCPPQLILLPCGASLHPRSWPQMPWPLGSLTSSPAMISSSLDQLLRPTVKLPRDFFLAPGPPKSPRSDFLLACSFKPTPHGPTACRQHHLSPPPSPPPPLLLLAQPQGQGQLSQLLPCLLPLSRTWRLLIELTQQNPAWLHPSLRHALLCSASCCRFRCGPGPLRQPPRTAVSSAHSQRCLAPRRC